MRPIRVTLAMLTLCVTTTLLSAQTWPPKAGIGILVRGSQVSGDLSHNSPGISAGLLLRYRLFKNFALSASTAFGGLKSGLDAIETTVFKNTLSANLFLVSRGRLKPYVSVGYSRLHYSTKDKFGQPIIRGDGSRMKGWANAFKIGLGLEIFFGTKWTVSTAGTYNATDVDELDAITGGANDGLFNGQIAAMYYFGGKPKRDNSVSMSDKDSEETVSDADGEQASKNNGIEFEDGTAKLLPSSYARLDKLHDYLVEHPEENLELLPKNQDQTDPETLKLLTARARTVKAYLVKKGIDPERIIIEVEED